MTRAEIETVVTELLTTGGWTNTSPAPDATALVNEALRLFSAEAQYNKATENVTTVVGTAEYSLTSDWVLIQDAMYNAAFDLAITDEDVVRRGDPIWRLRPNGTPQAIWLVETNKVRVFPTPDTAIANGIVLYGVIEDAQLATSIASPTCASRYHRGVAYWGAHLHADKYARGDERTITEGWLDKAVRYAEDCRATLDKAGAAAAQRYVKRRRAERISLSGFRR